MQGDSPEHHELRGRHYAEAKGWEVVKFYRLEAMSGKSVMGYSETQKMMQDIKTGAITGLIFSKLARLARNTKELLEFADFFRDNDADLISLEEAIDTSTPAGRLFYSMIAAMAQWEREEISARISASVPIRAKLGKRLGGVPAYGYAWDGKQFVLDEQEAPVRKLMYDLYIKYKRKKTVARELNNLGYRTRNGLLFTDTTIERLIKDPIAKGIRRANWKDTKSNIKPESEWVLLPAPAIISEDTYNMCNSILQVPKDKPRRGRQPMHLLAGYVYCEFCDKKMYVFHEHLSNYKCNSCKNRIQASDLEEIYHGQLKTFLLTDEDVKAYNEKNDVRMKEKMKLLKTVSIEVEQLRKKMNNIFDMRSSNEMTKERFAEQYWPLEERLGQLEKQLPELQADVDFLKIEYASSDIVLSDARNLYDSWLDMAFENKRSIVETITDRITVGKEDVNLKLAYLPTFARNGGNKQHADKHVLPISELNISVKIRNKAYPKQLSTIGDHIRKRRLDLKLFQRELAEMVGVHDVDVCKWENNKVMIPESCQEKIIAFLGYNPAEKV